VLVNSDYAHIQSGTSYVARQTIPGLKEGKLVLKVSKLTLSLKKN
jgi:hypothetical protein